MSYKWLDWAQRIQAISQAGLTYTQNEYDKERYEELRIISAEILEEYTDHEMEHVKEIFAKELGYPTPKVDVRGVVFQDNKILMVREKIDDKWALPGGFCEVGLSAKENVVKEIKEEAGYHVIPTKLLALFDMRKHGHPPQGFHYYKFFIRCEIIGGQAKIGMETKDIRFFSQDHLPELSVERNTRSQIEMMFDFLKYPNKETILE
ncbi:MAG: NUDIX hydrolase [Heyndrickxia sp.]